VANLCEPPCVQTGPVDERLLAAVNASRRWYDDIFDLHRIPVGCDESLWWAEGAPPRWHSAVKTLVPTSDPTAALRRMDLHATGSVADSFGLLDLSAHGFDLLIAARWLHHPGVASGPSPADWVRVLDADLMDRWNQRQDTVGVLPSDLWAHPRFTVLARRDGDDLTGGAVLHEAESVVGLSNTWSAQGSTLDPGDLLLLAAGAHPGRPVVDYAWGDELDTMVDGGFEPLGPQHIWLR
jgi:hypothetical protein